MCIKDFGVALKVNYDYELEDNNLIVDYEIKLAKDKKTIFGIIECEYCFEIEVDSFDLLGGEITDAAVRRCLKLNHNNIYKKIHCMNTK